MPSAFVERLGAPAFVVDVVAGPPFALAVANGRYRSLAVANGRDRSLSGQSAAALAPACAEGCGRCIAEGRAVEVVTEIGGRPWRTTLTPLFDDDGHIAQVLGTCVALESGEPAPQSGPAAVPALVRQVPGVAAAAIDADGRLLGVNAGWCGIFGYDGSEASGLTVADLVPAARRAAVRRLVGHVAAGRRDRLAGDGIAVTKTGRVRIVHVVISGCRDTGGRPVVVATVEDVTASWRTVRLLRAAQRDRQDMIFRLGPDTVVTHVDGPCAPALGCDAKALIGCRLTDFLPVADRARVHGALVAMTAAGPEFRTEHRWIGSDGNVRWFLWTYYGVFDADGRVAGYDAVAVGVVDRKRLEAQNRLETELRDSRTRFHLAVTAARDGLWEWEIATGRMWFSPRWKEMLGYGDTDLAGDRTTWDAVVHPEDRPRVSRLFDEHWHRGTPLDTTLRLCHRDGTVRQVLCRGDTIRDSDGRPVRTIGANTDVTLLTEAREALRVAKAQAEQANRAKSEFLAMMSHELRTPLNAVIGFAEILRDQLFGPLGSDRYNEYVELILNSGRHLFSIINDILDISNVDAGQVVLRETIVDLGILAQGLVNQFRVQAAAAGVTMDLAVDEAGARVRGDDARIRQIILNLLSNAIKFSRPGDRVRISAGNRDDGTVRLAVADTGIGMAAEDVPRALMPFSQLDSSLARRHEGTGLGLATVKRLVELHGATLDIQTELGRGTVVSVLFPRRRNAALDAEPGSDAPKAARIDTTPAWLARDGAGDSRFALQEALFDAVPVGVAIVTEDGICLRVNPVLARLAGQSEAQLTGRPLVDLFPGEHGDARLVTEPGPRESELQTADRRPLTVELTSAPFQGHDGVGYRLVIIVDLTTDRDLALALEASEDRFDLVVRAAGWGSWDANMVTGQRWLSPSFVAMLGDDPAEEIDPGRFWRDRTHPDDLPAVEAGIAAHLNGRTPALQARFRIRHRDGRYRWIAIRGISAFDSAHRPTRFVGVMVDVTAEEDLRSSLRGRTALLETVLASMTQGILIVDAQKRLRLMSAPVRAIYDFPPSLAAPDTPVERLCRFRIDRGDFGVVSSAAEANRMTAALLARIFRDQPSPVQERLPNGRIVEIVRRWSSHDGDFVVVVTDITEWRRTEGELRLNQRHLRQACDIAKLGYWRRNVATAVAGDQDDSVWSDSLFDICGHDPATFMPSLAAWLSIVHPDDRAAVRDLACCPEGRFACEYRICRPDGGVRYVRDDFKTDIDPADGTRRTFGVVQDITERKLQEIALAAQTAHLRAILDVAVTGIISIDQEGRIDVFNRMAERMFGWTSDAILGQSISLLFSDPAGAVSGAGERPFLSTVAVGAGVDGTGSERMARRRDGSTYPVQIAVEPFRSGGRQLFVCVVVDVSQQKNRERELRETRDHLLSQTRALEEARLRAEAANQAKSEFLAQMSHELRTPLNAIIGFSEIMQGEYFGPMGSPKYREYADDLHASGVHLLSLINDILDLSKVEAGRYVLEEGKVAIDRLVEESVRLLRQRAANKGVSLVMRLEPTPIVIADPRALKQILVNLLTNAVKFTVRGGTVEVRSGPDADGGVRLSVEDSGIGIPTAELETILQPFRQASNARRSGEQGTGLGLAIVRSLVELHHGTFEIRSEVGIGTAALVRLPASRVVRTEAIFRPWDVLADDA